MVFLCVLVVQLCPTLCNPTDCALPGSSIDGILQARILEWVASSFSRGSSQHRDRTQASHTVGRPPPSEPPGKPLVFLKQTKIWEPWVWRNFNAKSDLWASIRLCVNLQDACHHLPPSPLLLDLCFSSQIPSLWKWLHHLLRSPTQKYRNNY